MPEARQTGTEALEKMVEERTRELTTLLEISRDVTSNLSLGSVLQEILEKLKSVVRYTNATIVRLEGDRFINIADHLHPTFPSDFRIQFPADNFIDRHVMRTLAPLIIGDIHTEDTEAARDFRRQAGEVLNAYYQPVRNWMRVPLIFKGSVTGMLTLHFDQPDYYTAHHASLAMAFAEYAAIAIENARLYETAERKTAELETLLQVSRSVASTLEIRPLVNVILDQLQHVVEFNLASVDILEDDDLIVLAAYGEGLPPPGTRSSLKEQGVSREILAHRLPKFVRDLTGDMPLARAVRKGLVSHYQGKVRSWMAAPLISRETSIGLLSLAHEEPDYYTPERVDLVTAFGQQAAVAIENARLYEQAQGLAAIEERQKLARELHDSVSQALYGISLGVRTAQALLARDPALVGEPLDYIASLAEAGMAEMRALIFELRPESLEKEGLVAALTKQSEAIRTRHALEVFTHFCPEPDLSLDVKEALYRIAQESLHNIVKHARASRVELRLESDERGGVALTIRDDGLGFDTHQDFPGHLGLRSMAERTERIGGEFELKSEPKAGTEIHVRLR